MILNYPTLYTPGPCDPGPDPQDPFTPNLDPSPSILRLQSLTKPHTFRCPLELRVCVLHFPLFRSRLKTVKSSNLSLGFAVSLMVFNLLFMVLSDGANLSLSLSSCSSVSAVLYTLMMIVLLWTAFLGLGYFKLYYVVFERDWIRKVTDLRLVAGVSLGKHELAIVTT